MFESADSPLDSLVSFLIFYGRLYTSYEQLLVSQKRSSPNVLCQQRWYEVVCCLRCGSQT